MPPIQPNFLRVIAEAPKGEDYSILFFRPQVNGVPSSPNLPNFYVMNVIKWHWFYCVQLANKRFLKSTIL